MNVETSGPLGLGVDAGLAPDLARDLAARCVELGYTSLWANDEPTAPGLETLAHFSDGAPELDLGIGVLPIDQHPPAKIASDVERLGLDPVRLWIGIGSGRLRPQLAPMRDAVAELRERLPGARVMVGTMSRNLCRLGGEIADGVLANWMTPPVADEARAWVHDGAAAVRRPAPTTALYVRVAIGLQGATRLQTVEEFYRRLAPAHFATMGAPLGSVGLVGITRDEVVAGLAPYRSAVDLPIVRALAGRDLTSLLAVAEAAAP
jgi:alkanesulfonate monooxygenase SsuD/methylene tetrahydromethanopterin reductase-like flavin-dependent oxidoreductase (luciferase family)